MSADGISRIRQDVSDLITVVAGLNDALKYVIHHGEGGAEQAEAKRQGAERRIFKMVDRY